MVDSFTEQFASSVGFIGELRTGSPFNPGDFDDSSLQAELASTIGQREVLLEQLTTSSGASARVDPSQGRLIVDSGAGAVTRTTLRYFDLGDLNIFAAGAMSTFEFDVLFSDSGFESVSELTFDLTLNDGAMSATFSASLSEFVGVDVDPITGDTLDASPRRIAIDLVQFTDAGVDLTSLDEIALAFGTEGAGGDTVIGPIGFGVVGTVPSPATAAMLAAGGLVCARRRR
ncbi:MAG: hypothetical protein AAGI17_11620 [Planctomycetota bacterium]